MLLFSLVLFSNLFENTKKPTNKLLQKKVQLQNIKKTSIASNAMTKLFNTSDNIILFAPVQQKSYQ